MVWADGSTEFPVAHCTVCKRDVVCYHDLDDGGLELVRCLDCSSPIDPTSIRWLGLYDIEALGYGLASPARNCGPWECQRTRCGRVGPPVDDQG